MAGGQREEFIFCPSGRAFSIGLTIGFTRQVPDRVGSPGTIWRIFRTNSTARNTGETSLQAYGKGGRDWSDRCNLYRSRKRRSTVGRRCQAKNCYVRWPKTDLWPLRI